MASSATQFILKGFSEIEGFRVFAFEGIEANRTRTAFTVKTNLGLTRRYGIRLQELPLLCRAVLEREHLGGEARTFTYTEQDMCDHARLAALREAANKQRKPRRPASPGHTEEQTVPPFGAVSPRPI